MADARFKIGDKVYTTAALDEISLRDVLVFEAETAALGVPMKWDEVQGWASELDAMHNAKSAESHPNALMMLAVTVWASRRTAGEAVTFEEAIDFPVAQLTFLADPEDRKPGPTRARKGPAKKKSTPRSAPAGPALGVGEGSRAEATET